MPLNITTNSAAASASYYLGKNQSALQKSINRLGQREEDHRTLRRSREPFGLDETTGFDQSTWGCSEQCKERDLISRSTGRYSCLCRADS